MWRRDSGGVLDNAMGVRAQINTLLSEAHVTPRVLAACFNIKARSTASTQTT
jgi:hypothetical protein